LNAVNYVVTNHIPGDIAECGVWRGGSMMAVALALLSRGETSRALYLYDTYEGMSEPTQHDRSHDGVSAADQPRPDSARYWRLVLRKSRGCPLQPCCYGIIPRTKFTLVKGKVEETIPGTLA